MQLSSTSDEHARTHARGTQARMHPPPPFFSPTELKGFEKFMETLNTAKTKTKQQTNKQTKTKTPNAQKVEKNADFNSTVTGQALGPVPHFRFRGRLETAKERLSHQNKQLSLVFCM